MKRLLFLAACAVAWLSAQDLSGVHAVYLLPMGRGLDQFLANQLTQEHVFQVVTDPKLADAVFSDRIGPAFEEKLAGLQPSPPPASPPPKTEQAAGPKSLAAAAAETASPPPVSTLGTGKGTVFLVDTKSHRVLWSAFRPPKSSSPTDVNRTASDIVSRLKRDLKPR